MDANNDVHINRPTNIIPELLAKLNKLYDKEELIKKQLIQLYAEFNQLQEDKEVMQTMIMHQSNKIHRFNKYIKG